MVADGVTAKIGDAKENPENEGRKQHGEDGSRSDLFNHAILEAEAADDEATEKILDK